MRFAAAVRRGLSGVTVGVGLCLSFTVPVGAVTQVSALVCGSDGHASLVLSQPKSDSIVADAHLTLSGTTLQASQVSTTLDGTYDQTVALAAGQPSFSLTMVLDPGTHTITVTAVDMCGQHNATSQLVVTYQPTAQETGAQPTATVGGVTIEPQGTTTPVVQPSAPLSFLEQAFAAIGANLDIGQTVTSTPLQQAARISFVTVGLVFAVFGTAVPLLGPMQLLIGSSKFAIAGSVPRIIGIIFILVGLLV